MIVSEVSFGMLQDPTNPAVSLPTKPNNHFAHVNPSVCIMYHNYQAYPMYIVTYNELLPGRDATGAVIPVPSYPLPVPVPQKKSNKLAKVGALTAVGACAAVAIAWCFGVAVPVPALPSLTISAATVTDNISSAIHYPMQRLFGV